MSLQNAELQRRSHTCASQLATPVTDADRTARVVGRRPEKPGRDTNNI
jgi:hypothetical protein